MSDKENTESHELGIKSHQPSKSSRAQKEVLLSEYIESLQNGSTASLDVESQALFDQLCEEDNEFASHIEQAKHLIMLKKTSPDAEVPPWQHRVDFPFAEKTPWWQWQGMPITSFCCSIFAIIMVISGFNISVDNGRLSMGFSVGSGSNVSSAELAALVDQKMQVKLAEQAQVNQDLMTHYLSQYTDLIQQQQLQTSAQLSEYLLSSNRQERREDFAELIKFVNQQRYDDQVFYVRQLNELQEEINMQSGIGVDVVRPVSDINFDE